MKHIYIIAIVLFTSFATLFSSEKREAADKFVENLHNRKYEQVFNHFSVKVKEVISLEKTKQMWDQIISGFGEPLELISIDSADVNNQILYTIVYTHQKADLEYLISVDNDNNISGLYFKPAKKESFNFPVAKYVVKNNFNEEDIVLGKGSKIELDGKICIPKGKGPYPLVILVHVSGPNDMDETIGPNKPFRDIAWGLASKGIATLRYDKRTYYMSQNGIAPEKMFTMNQETVEDAIQAVREFKNYEKIDPENIFILGHSLGGYAIPRIGQNEKSIKGFINLAGLARELPHTIVQQVNYLSALDGEISVEEKAMIDTLEAKLEIFEGGNFNRYSDYNFMGINAAYLHDLRFYKPAKEYTRVNKAMLVINGERDYQVTSEDFIIWKKALESRSDVTFKMFSGLNHLMMKGEGQPNPKEYEKEGHVELEVINFIERWIKRIKKQSHSKD